MSIYFRSYVMEWKKILSYRAEFWINTLGQLALNLIIPTYIWHSIFEAKNIKMYYGLKLEDYILYYLCAFLTYKIVSGSIQHGAISQEIYQGSLNKFLIYPISFQFFKLFAYLAHSSLHFISLIILLLLSTFWNHHHFSTLGIFYFSITIFTSYIGYFFLYSLVEYLAFYADNIWTLQVLVRILYHVFGGLYLPLFSFPEWGQQILIFTPFPYFLYYPVSFLLDYKTPVSFLACLGGQFFWTMIFYILGNYLWRKGLKTYSGIGM